MLKDHDGRPTTRAMDRGLYVAASGMVSEMLRQDLIANDLANASTPGYKADRASQSAFGELLLQNTASGETVGKAGLGVVVDRVVTDTAPGPVRDTGEALDFAIVGDGFFAVRTAQGERYTRNGRFMRGQDGTLVTAQGETVLGPNGTPVRVAADGTVDPRSIGVFTVKGAAKSGESLWTGTRGGAAGGTVRAGALEASGADATHAMVEMIASLRAYEAGQRVITTIDETLGKAVGQVGSAPGA
jgi:flagellar basal-body rod protein FlgG